MKNFFVLTSFLITTSIGLFAANLFQPSAKADRFFHQNNFCVFENPDEQFFTLEEANEVSGKKVISKKRNSIFGKSGRIVSFEMIAPDEFLIEIYWGNGADDENSAVTFHDKSSFLENFEVVN